MVPPSPVTSPLISATVTLELTNLKLDESISRESIEIKTPEGYAVDKTEPVDISDIISIALGLPGVGMDPFVREHMVYEHPLLALLTTWVDVADTASYAHLISTAPRAGFDPKSVLHIEGTSDPFTPPPTHEALALAGRFPQVSPYLERIPNHETHGLASVSAPVTGNGAGGMHTVGLVQYDGGHFVSTDPPAEATPRSMADLPTSPATLRSCTISTLDLPLSGAVSCSSSVSVPPKRTPP